MVGCEAELLDDSVQGCEASNYIGMHRFMRANITTTNLQLLKSPGNNKDVSSIVQ